MPDADNSDLVADVGSVLLVVAFNTILNHIRFHCGMNCY